MAARAITRTMDGEFMAVRFHPKQVVQNLNHCTDTLYTSFEILSKKLI